MVILTHVKSVDQIAYPPQILPSILDRAFDVGREPLQITIGNGQAI
jgi:hypothetical protein